MAQSKIVQGEDRVLEFRLIDEVTNVPFNLAGVTEINATTKGTAANVSFLLSNSEIIIADAAGGLIKINVTETKSALIKLGEQDVEITVDWGANTAGTRRIFQSLKAILVIKDVQKAVPEFKQQGDYLIKEMQAGRNIIK